MNDESITVEHLGDMLLVTREREGSIWQGFLTIDEARALCLALQDAIAQLENERADA